ncbi:HTH_Tnp_Tc3_2 domain-containing protein [Trichonephila clavipes]|nr:HTH_Tnp_Tc3_2 domain-containing protein [Trichonephila clavipes]
MQITGSHQMTPIVRHKDESLEVSVEFGLTQNVISVSRRYSTGRPQVTTLNVDRYFTDTAKRNRWITISDMSCQPFSATGMAVSRQTVYIRLGQIGRYARRRVRCVPLTASHYRLRIPPVWVGQNAHGLESSRACAGKLGRRVASRQTFRTCLPKLRLVRIALLDEWCNFPQDQIDNLILRMLRLCMD